MTTSRVIALLTKTAKILGPEERPKYLREMKRWRQWAGRGSRWMYASWALLGLNVVTHFALRWGDGPFWAGMLMCGILWWRSYQCDQRAKAHMNRAHEVFRKFVQKKYGKVITPLP